MQDQFSETHKRFNEVAGSFLNWGTGITTANLVYLINFPVQKITPSQWRYCVYRFDLGITMFCLIMIFVYRVLDVRAWQTRRDVGEFQAIKEHFRSLCRIHCLEMWKWGILAGAIPISFGLALLMSGILILSV